MAPNFRLQVLGQTEQLIVRLHQQISGSATSSLTEDSDWGFGGVTSAMGGFYGDWSYHRQLPGVTRPGGPDAGRL